MKRINLFKKLTTWINKHAINLENLIICGDFNCKLVQENNDKSNGILKNIIEIFYLKDSWIYSEKIMNKDKPGVTKTRNGKRNGMENRMKRKTK